MANDKTLNRRLRSFGLTARDLTADELVKVRRDMKGSGTGGFLSSEDLIAKGFRKRCCGNNKRK